MCRTYDFKVMRLEDGQEIAYKGPYTLCCQFFDNSNCVWEGEYPNQVRPDLPFRNILSF